MGEEEDPVMLREALRFLYSGLPPENLGDIASGLLPIADKFCLDELKRRCDVAIRRSISKANIVDVLQLAENYHCPDLFEYCVPFFKANVKTLKGPCGTKLQSDPKLLFKLFQAC